MQYLTCILVSALFKLFQLKFKTNNKKKQKSVSHWHPLLQNSSKATKLFQKCQTTPSLSGPQNSNYKTDLVMGLLAEYSSSCSYIATAVLLLNLWLSHAFFMEF